MRTPQQVSENTHVQEKLIDCVSAGGAPKGFVGDVLDRLGDTCQNDTEKNCFVCPSSLEPKGLPNACVASCAGNNAVTIRPNPNPIPEPSPPPSEGIGPIMICPPKNNIPFKHLGCYGELLINHGAAGCTSVVLVCDEKSSSFILFHELTHAIGVIGNKDHGKKKPDVVNRVESCLKGVPK